MHLVLSLLACKGGTDSAEGGSLTGTVATDRAEGVVDIQRAFGFHVDGRGLWYLSNSPEATCESVTQYLSKAAVDPTGVWDGGTCNLVLKINPQLEDSPRYDGSALTWGNDDGQGMLVGDWGLACALGDGSFEWTTRDSGSDYYDYFWQGVEWRGAPYDWTVTVSGDGEAEPYLIETEFTDLRGNYPGESTGEQIPATGTVSGWFEAERCTDLYDAMVFPK